MSPALRASRTQRHPPMSRTARLVPLLLLTAAACAAEREPAPAERALRRDARRDACIAEALQERARSRLATLDTLLAQAREHGDVPAMVSAPHTFAQVYATIADLHAHERAYVDSAYHARSREDSLRYETAAASYRVARPSSETLEANVQRDYAQDFLSARADPDHICNHLVADGEPARGRGK